MKIHRITRVTTSAVFLSLFFFLLSATVATGQTRRSIPDIDPQASDEQGERFGASLREMRYRSHFERLDAEHKQNLKRAAEAVMIASQLLQSYNQNCALSSNDVKNLEKLDKVARRIRGYAGGSDDDHGSDLAATTALGDSLSQIVELSSGLQQEVERTSRQIVSAKIITDANRVIALVRHARSLTR